MKIRWCYYPIIGLLLLSACVQTPSPLQSIQTPYTRNETVQPTDDPWGDYGIYRLGLISSEQSDLTSFPNASVYHININIADDKKTLSGQEDIRYTNQENQTLKEVYFQLFPNMEGGKSTLTNITADGTPVSFRYEQNEATIKAILPSGLKPGEKTTLHLDFEVDIPQDAGGNYGLFGYIDNILVLDGFYPAIPVYDGKGWHEGQLPPNSDTTFQDVSYYLVTVTAPSDLVLVASGVKVVAENQDGKQVITFAQGPSRDFYLAASSDFKVISEKVGETTVNSYTITGLDKGSKVALDTAVNAIKTYNKYMGTYPYTEFDVVSTPMQGAYGIEYPGIVGINYTLYGSDGQSISPYLESTVAHEAGHQWFYNIVGDDQINEPWLDESMTQYITGLYFLDQYGEQGFESYKSSWYLRWDRINREEMAIGLPAGSYEGREYSGIVYGRGPIFVYELSKTMGQGNFDRFLKDYYLQYKWGIATTAGFQELAEKECGCDLTDLFNEWVYQ